MRFQMQIMMYITYIMANSACSKDIGIDKYSQYLPQNTSYPIGSSDLSDYMASPVSQNILQQNQTSSYIPPGMSQQMGSQMSPPYMATSQHMANPQQMSSISPQSQGSYLTSLLMSPQGLPGNCNNFGDEKLYKAHLDSQIQNIKNTVLTCKSIYGEDSNLCCLDGKCLDGLKQLNTTTKTGIPCLDAMTYSGLGPANTNSSALITSNRADSGPYGGPYGASNMPSVGYNSQGFGHSGNTNALCEGMPASFCSMMKGPLFGQIAPKKCNYQGDLINVNEYCKRNKCVDGCPVQTKCSNFISGGSGCISNGMSYQPMGQQMPMIQPNMMQQIPMVQQMPIIQNPQMVQHPNMMQQIPIVQNPQTIQHPYNQPNMIHQPYNQPNMIQPNMMQQPYNQYQPNQQPYNQYQLNQQQHPGMMPQTYPQQTYQQYPDTYSGYPGQYDEYQYNNYKKNKRYSKKKYKNYDYRYRNYMDGIVVIEPHSSLYNYIKNVVNDPNRVKYVGDKKCKGWFSSSLKEQPNTTMVDQPNASALVGQQCSQVKDSSSTNESHSSIKEEENPKKKKVATVKKAKAKDKSSKSTDNKKKSKTSSTTKKSKTSPSSTTKNSSSETQNVFQDSTKSSSSDTNDDPKRYVSMKQKCLAMVEKESKKEKDKKKKSKKIAACNNLVEKEDE